MTASLPVAYYLRELSGESGRRGGESASDVEFRIAEAHQRGVADGRAAAKVEGDAATAALLADADKRLAAERGRWSEEEGRRLAELIETSMGDIQARIADQVSQVLKPILGEEVRRVATARLSQSLTALLSKGEYAKISIAGPRDLLGALEESLSGLREGIQFTAADQTDIVVSADDTILETRIGAWMHAIEEDMGISRPSAPLSAGPQGESA